MIKINEIYLPEGEEHLVMMIRDHNPLVEGKGVYQYHKYQEVKKFVRQFRTAIDVGAHVGLWSRVMAMDFDSVECFEPRNHIRRCWYKNVEGHHNANIHRFACTTIEGPVLIDTPTPNSSGDSYVVFEESETTEHCHGVPIDDFKFPDVDFIKLDCEGYELFALKGAVETLKRWKPALCIEQKAGFGAKFGIEDQDGVEFVLGLGLGYEVKGTIQGDYFMAVSR